MIKKNVVLDIGMYDENIKYAQDYKLFIDLLKKRYKIKILKNKLYVLNMENNISSLKTEEQQSFLRKFKKKNLENKHWFKKIDGPFGGGNEFLKILLIILKIVDIL